MKHHKLSEIPAEQVTDLFARKFFNGEKITLAFLTLKKDCVVPQHHHESEQFSYVVTGALQFQIGTESAIVRAGELVQIPSNVPHSVVTLEDSTVMDIFSPIRLDWITGDDSYLRQG